MGNAEQSRDQPATEKPVESVEGDGKGEGENTADAGVTDTQWRSMMDVLLAIYDYREEDGYDPSRLFHRSVNKRNVPDYYDIIKEPMALSILKQKINKREYKAFSEFVRDCALIPHNAQTYNRPKSQAYEDALVIKDVFIAEFGKLVKYGIISAEDAELPDLGEIPEPDPLPEEVEEEEEEDEEEDEEDVEDTDDGRKKRRGPRPGFKREGRDERKSIDPDVRKKRGRPPRVDTPTEARIKVVLKGIRKLKGPGNQLKVGHFERLPDKGAYPDYYIEIKEPVAIDIIKKNFKRKKYNSVDHFMRDIELMFNNAKAYNQPESQIYKDAVDLQVEARRLAEIEKKKPDSEYLMEDGRLPLPEGISYKGETFKVGDWVHIQNPNDVTKPIVAQIYRTWQDPEGDKWVNTCWYYRPEQTVHNFEKHFFPNEVVKTGQYRDHRIDEIVDRCFVMFLTRYCRGRPRGFPPDKEVYVCEARYNEEKAKLNKIKTWASCLPDEVREKDYEMDLFDIPRRIKKVPSPIKHLLKNDAKETDDLPKATWGAENAPPVVGAIHRRPRDENESPPPEPTPSPPPVSMPTMPTSRQASMGKHITRPSMDSQTGASIAGNVAPVPVHSSAAQSPMPMSSGYQQAPVTSTQMYQSSLQRRASNFAQSPTPYQGHNPYGAAQTSPYVSYQPTRLHPTPPTAPTTTMYNANAPRPIEVFHLSDSANAAIPADIREQFHTDDKGHVLFFSSQPMDIVPSSQQTLSHSLKYLATKDARRAQVAANKRKKAHEQAETDSTTERSTKRLRTEESTALSSKLSALTTRAIEQTTRRIASGTDRLYEALYGPGVDAKRARLGDEKMREEGACARRAALDEMERIRRESEVGDSDATGMGIRKGPVYLDDVEGG